MIDVVTIGGEYDGGSAELGLVVLKLGWQLLDRQLVGAWRASLDSDPKPQLVSTGRLAAGSETLWQPRMVELSMKRNPVLQMEVGSCPLPLQL